MPIKITEFPGANPNDVASNLRKKDKEYLIVEHSVITGENIPEDIHQANEWIILPPIHGFCKIMIESEAEVVKLNPEGVMVIAVPTGKKHSFLALSAFSYTVLRDGFN